jgi:hypothetical protein
MIRGRVHLDNGSGSSGSSSALYGVFIAKKLEIADKGSGDTTTVNVQTDY